jgi:hypothetical protein
MPKQGNEYLLDAEDLKTLIEARDLLDMMKNGNPLDVPIYKAWKALEEVIHPVCEDEVEFARRIA